MLKTIKYYRSEGNYGWNRVEEYDENYGTPKKTPRSDYRFAVLRENGSVAERWQALAELRKPIWGENNDKKFSELLPPMKELPSQYIQVPEYFWREYDKDSGIAPTEAGIQYELGLEMSPSSWRIITITFDGTYTLLDILKQYGLFTHFRKKKIGSTVVEINPEYEPAVAVREQEKIEVEALLKENLILTATHVFPALPLNDILTANLIDKYNLSSANEIHPEWLWKWKELGEDGIWVDLPIDSNHPLAVPGPRGGWKTIRKPIRPNPELRVWDAAVLRGFDYKRVYTPDQKVKLILGLSV